MLTASEIEKELRYLTLLKAERFNDAQLDVLANAQEYGKDTPQLKALEKKLQASTKDPTINMAGRFRDEFPGKKENYIDGYSANRWQDYLICEGPDPKKNTSIQRFIENVLDNDFHDQINISTLLVVGSPNDKLDKNDNLQAFADYFSNDGNYGQHTLKRVTPDPDKSTANIKHYRLLVKKNGREIKEIDVYRVLESSLNVNLLTIKDLKLLQEIAQIEPAKLATHDVTGLDYAAAFILSFSFYRNFKRFIGNDDKVFKQPGKMLRSLNDARPGAIQSSEQFKFSIRLFLDLYRAKLDIVQSQNNLSLQNQNKSNTNAQKSPLLSPPRAVPILANAMHHLKTNGQAVKEEKGSPGLPRSSSAKHMRFSEPANHQSSASNSRVAVSERSGSPSGLVEAKHQISSSVDSSAKSESTVLNGNGLLTNTSSDTNAKTIAVDIPTNVKSTLHDSGDSTSPQSTESLSNYRSGANLSFSEDGKVRLVCIIGTLDTKRAENEELRRLLIKQGFATFIIDVGTYEPTDVKYPVDVKIEQIVAAAGYNIKDLRKDRQNSIRSITVAAVKAGLTKYIIELNDKYKFDAVIGMGGSNGTDIVTSAMQQLSENIPRICISTVAGHNDWKYTQGSGILLFNSRTDIGGGVNSLIGPVILQAVLTLSGLLSSPRTRLQVEQKVAPKKPTIVTSKFGVTTPAVDAIAEVLQKKHGFNVLQFHMVGTGGLNMEGLIQAGAVDGVLDITLAEITSLLDNGVWSAGPTRLAAPVKMGIPQVISLGAMDMTMLDEVGSTNPIHASRTIYKCNPNVYAMKNGIPQFNLFARYIIEKLSYAKAPVILLIPARGLSAFDKARPKTDTIKSGELRTTEEKISIIVDNPYRKKDTEKEKQDVKDEQKVFVEDREEVGIPLPSIDAPNDRTKDIIWYDPYANRFFFKLIRSLAAMYAPQIIVVEMDSHINDPQFAQLATRLMLLALAIHEHFKDDYENVLRNACQIAIFECGWNAKKLGDIDKEAEKTSKDILQIIEKVKHINNRTQYIAPISLFPEKIDEYKKKGSSPSTSAVPHVLSYAELPPGTALFSGTNDAGATTGRRNSAPPVVQLDLRQKPVLPGDEDLILTTSTAARASPEHQFNKPGVQQ